MDIQPIKGESAYQLAVERIEALWDVKSGSPEADELDILATLVDAYESKTRKIEAPDPIAAILFRLEQEGLPTSALEKFLGQKSRVTEILKRQHPLSINMIRRLHEGLRIPSDVLIQKYELAK